MAKKKKKMPSLNTTSTADISFMLLIFFLVTTSMDTDMGLARRLPKPPEPDQEDATMDIKSRNILYVRLNHLGELWIEDEMNRGFSDFKELRNRVKEFVKNGGKIYIDGEAPTLIDAREADLSWLKSNMTFDELKEKGFWVYGADMDGEDARSVNFDGAAVLVTMNLFGSFVVLNPANNAVGLFPAA